MNLLLLLEVDDINYLIQKFIGNCIVSFNKENINKFILKTFIHNISENDFYTFLKKNETIYNLSLFFSEDLENTYQHLFKNFNKLIYLNIDNYNLSSEFDLINICNYKNLKKLHLTNCCGFCNIPFNINNLIHLETLNLSGSKIDNISNIVDNLHNLKHLDISYCYELEKLPTKIGSLKSLKTFYLSYCRKIKYIPNSFFDLKNLEILDFSYNRYIWSKLDKFENFINLKHLNLKSNNTNFNFTKLFNLKINSNIEYLNINNLPIHNLEIVKPLIHLKELNLNGCNLLKNYNFLDKLIGLNTLYFINNSITNFPNNIKFCNNLSFLYLDIASLLEFPIIIFELKKLKKLIIENGFLITSIPKGFYKLQKLNILELINFNISILPCDISTLQNLYSLKIIDFNNLKELPYTFCFLNALKYFKLSRCNLFKKSIQPILKLKNIITIELDNIHITNISKKEIYQIKEREEIEETKEKKKEEEKEKETKEREEEKEKEKKGKEINNFNVKELYITCNNSISFLDINHKFIYFNHLTTVHFNYCKFKTIPSYISNLVNLQYLKVENCSNLNIISNNIFKLHKLETLIFKNCCSLNSFPFILYPDLKDEFILKELISLSIINCPIININMEKNYNKNLNYLNLTKTNIYYIPTNIIDFQYLKIINLNNCINLKTLDPDIFNLPYLKLLNLSNCFNLTKLPYILNTKIEKIVLSNLNINIDYLPSSFLEKIHF